MTPLVTEFSLYGKLNEVLNGETFKCPLRRCADCPRYVICVTLNNVALDPYKGKTFLHCYGKKNKNSGYFRGDNEILVS